MVMASLSWERAGGVTMASRITGLTLLAVAGACGGGGTHAAGPVADSGPLDATAPLDAGPPSDAEPPSDAGPVDAAVDASRSTIAATFFGKHWSTAPAWPNATFGSAAFGSGIEWSSVETDAGHYLFGTMDTWLDADKAPGRGQDLTWMYAAIHTPGWAGGTGNPPWDLYDGGTCAGLASTNDCAFKAFLTTALDHFCTGTAPNKTCAFTSWELHNEVNASDTEWAGTYPELVQMDSDGLAVIKSQCASCLVLSSNVSAGGNGFHSLGKTSANYATFMTAYLQAWQQLGTAMPDVLTWHPYPSTDDRVPPPFPETFDGADCGPTAPPNKYCVETIVSQVQTMRAIADANGMKGKPLWATEGGYGHNAELVTTEAGVLADDLRAAYVARWQLVLASGGVERTYWYAWDDLVSGTEFADGGETSVGIADQQVYDWLVGNTFDVPCSNGDSGTVWTCDLSGPNELLERVVWDTAGNSSYPVPAVYTKWQDLSGPAKKTVSSPAAIGIKPILFVNQ
jgi:hypothetical protein